MLVRQSREEILGLTTKARHRFLGKGWTDIHTHLRQRWPGQKADFVGNRLFRGGPDETGAYHYLFGEAFALRNLTSVDVKNFWKLPINSQTDWLFSVVYDGSLPTSEAAKGPLTTAKALGIETSHLDWRKILKDWRTLYRDLGSHTYQERIFELAKVKQVIGTDSPFAREEFELFQSGAYKSERDERFLPALRMDELIHKREDPEFAALCGEMGFEDAVGSLLNLSTQTATRKLVEHWLDFFGNAQYIAVSLSHLTDFSNENDDALIVIEKILAPICAEREIPLVLMPFVERGIRSEFRNAGDVVKRGDIGGLLDLMSRHLETFFLVTPLHDNDNYDLSFGTRALGNFRIWGHWWCNLNPSLIEPQLRLRLSNNGNSHFGLNTDSRVIDHLVSKPEHYWNLQAQVLTDYAWDLQETQGVTITEEMLYLKIDALQSPTTLFELAKKRKSIDFAAEITATAA